MEEAPPVEDAMQSEATSPPEVTDAPPPAPEALPPPPAAMVPTSMVKENYLYFFSEHSILFSGF